MPGCLAVPALPWIQTYCSTLPTEGLTWRPSAVRSTRVPAAPSTLKPNVQRRFSALRSTIAPGVATSPRRKLCSAEDISYEGSSARLHPALLATFEKTATFEN